MPVFFLFGHNFSISEDSSNIEYCESALRNIIIQPWGGGQKTLCKTSPPITFKWNSPDLPITHCSFNWKMYSKLDQCTSPNNKLMITLYYRSHGEVDDLKKRIVESGSYKLIDSYTTSELGAQQAYLELDKIIRNVSYYFLRPPHIFLHPLPVWLRVGVIN